MLKSERSSLAGGRVSLCGDAGGGGLSGSHRSASRLAARSTLAVSNLSRDSIRAEDIARWGV